MAQSEQQRQRKLAKKQSKNREKHKLIARKQQELGSMAGKMQTSSRGEVLYCGICGTIDEHGIGHVVITRQGPSRLVGIGMFLVDVYCLGVKDVLADLRGPANVNEIIEQLERERGLKPVAPGVARGLVEAAVAYARALGFEPHADYRKASLIWGDIQAESVDGLYEFGRDGKPLYCSGPFEDSARQLQILRTLERSTGTNNFNFSQRVDAYANDDSELLESDSSELSDVDDEFFEAEDVRRIDDPHP